MKNVATVKMIQNIIDGVTPIKSKALLNSVCPVGKVFISADGVSPASIFGGTWEKIEGKFLLGAGGGGYTLNSVGGEAQHTLTVEEMPRHNHNLYTRSHSAGGGDYTVMLSNDTGNYYLSADATVVTGGSQPHNNMPPYVAVNIWKRVA